MFDGKFITTLFALIIAAVAVCNFNTNKIKSYENFGILPPRIPLKHREVKNHLGNTVNFTTNAFDNIPTVISSNPQFNQSLPNRSPGIATLAPLQKVKLNEKFLATSSPLHHAGFVEKYCNSGGDSYTSPPPAVRSESEKNYDEVLKQIQNDNDNDEITSTMPMRTMETISQNGESQDTIVYDRYVFANRHNRNRAHGDHIRGDLPITPCQPGWFRPSVNPAVDLHQGAMFILGGQDNSTSQAMARLINDTSGESTVSGVAMSTLTNTDGTEMLSTVNVNAFPN